MDSCFSKSVVFGCKCWEGEFDGRFNSSYATISLQPNTHFTCRLCVYIVVLMCTWQERQPEGLINCIVQLPSYVTWASE